MVNDRSSFTSPSPSWLETAVFYQIYPQSFYDSNGDGIGDLNGIRQKLGYLVDLGVKAVWINPCFVSPFMDAGYDISDYYRVAPRYGSNDDLKSLFDEAGRLGLHILLDLVPGHTSIEHPWFQQSCKHERNPYSDYYIWTDSAWEWHVPGFRAVSGYAERDGSFIANFFYHQPALNYGFANPDPAQPWQQPVDAPGPRQVRQEMRNVMRYWLEMGASGFRVDMAGSLVKGDPEGRATQALWQEIRVWLDEEFPEACLVSEWGRPSIAVPAGFHVDFCLPFGMPGYTSLLRKPYGPGPGYDPYGFSYFDPLGNGNICEFLDDYLDHYRNTRGRGFIAIPTGNHDSRVRLSQGRSPRDLELVYLFLMSMPGVPFIYYGDEIGMHTRFGLASREGGYDRTGVRTPMQWADTLNAGFSMGPTTSLYLPVDESPDRPTVAEQEKDPGSLLNRVRRLIALRKVHPALCASGEFRPLYAKPGPYPFVYLRSLGDESLLVAVNPAEREVEAELPSDLSIDLARALWGQDGALRLERGRWRLRLPGVSGGVYRISAPPSP
jgi:glycosidase